MSIRTRNVCGGAGEGVDVDDVGVDGVGVDVDVDVGVSACGSTKSLNTSFGLSKPLKLNSASTSFSTKYKRLLIIGVRSACRVGCDDFVPAGWLVRALKARAKLKYDAESGAAFSSPAQRPCDDAKYSKPNAVMPQKSWSNATVCGNACSSSLCGDQRVKPRISDNTLQGPR